MKRLAGSAAVAAAGVLIASGAPGAGASVAPHRGAASVPDATSNGTYNDGLTFETPPAGFNPLTASNEDLQKYGYPTRPPGTTPDWWLDFVQDTNRQQDPTEPHSDVTSLLGPSQPISPSTAELLGSSANETSGAASPDGDPKKIQAWANWTGFEVEKGSAKVWQIQESFTIPQVSQYPGDSGASSLVVWPGIGVGNSSDALVQAGSESRPSGSGTTSSCWTEIVPLEPYTVPLNMTCDPGDYIHVLIQIYAAGFGQPQHAFFEIKNYTHPNDVIRSTTFSGGWGSQAEWIAERPGNSSGGFFNLPNFSGFTIHDAVAQDQNLHNKNLSDGYSWKDIMENNCSDVIGYTSDPSTSTNAFSAFRHGYPSFC